MKLEPNLLVTLGGRGYKKNDTCVISVYSYNITNLLNSFKKFMILVLPCTSMINFFHSTQKKINKSI